MSSPAFCYWGLYEVGPREWLQTDCRGIVAKGSQSLGWGAGWREGGFLTNFRVETYWLSFQGFLLALLSSLQCPSCRPRVKGQAFSWWSRYSFWNSRKERMSVCTRVCVHGCASLPFWATCPLPLKEKVADHKVPAACFLALAFWWQRIRDGVSIIKEMMSLNYVAHYLGILAFLWGILMVYTDVQTRARFKDRTDHWSRFPTAYFQLTHPSLCWKRLPEGF